jgi:hypothetical protein
MRVGSRRRRFELPDRLEGPETRRGGDIGRGLRSSRNLAQSEAPALTLRARRPRRRLSDFKRIEGSIGRGLELVGPFVPYVGWRMPTRGLLKGEAVTVDHDARDLQQRQLHVSHVGAFRIYIDRRDVQLALRVKSGAAKLVGESDDHCAAAGGRFMRADESSVHHGVLDLGLLGKHQPGVRGAEGVGAEKLPGPTVLQFEIMKGPSEDIVRTAIERERQGREHIRERFHVAAPVIAGDLQISLLTLGSQGRVDGIADRQRADLHEIREDAGDIVTSAQISNKLHQAPLIIGRVGGHWEPIEPGTTGKECV